MLNEWRRLTVVTNTRPFLSPPHLGLAQPFVGYLILPAAIAIINGLFSLLENEIHNEIKVVPFVHIQH